jgi:hypothetical protein
MERHSAFEVVNNFWRGWRRSRLCGPCVQGNGGGGGMITPAYSSTATERVLPSMALDFLTGVLDPRVTIARALDTATRVNSSGVIEVVAANLPRFDYDPTTLTTKGLLSELTKTNLFLNSLVDGTNLSTQSVTLAASAYTLSFYGSGSITISGGHSATVNGIGDYPNRKTYAFTPTAGSSTFTVSGDVKFAQIELGSVSSFIPTASSSSTRNTDRISMTSSNFSSWYNQSEGAFAAEYIPPTIATTLGVLSVNDGTTNNRIDARSNGISFVTSGGATQAGMVATGAVANAINRCVVGYKLNSFAFAINGNAPATDTSGSIPTVSRLVIGAVDNFSPSLNGHMRKLRYWPLRITNAEVQAFSK